MSFNIAVHFPYVLLFLILSLPDYRSSVECRLENGNIGTNSGLKFVTNGEMTAGGSNASEDQNLSFGSRGMLQKKEKNVWKKPCGVSLNGANLYDKNAALSASKIWPYKWSPHPHRFLVLHCETGRISNRVFCILNALKFASILNRTLLGTLNRGEINHCFERRFIFDVHHVRKCYGNNTIITFDEYVEMYGRNITVDQVLCMNEKGCPIKDFSAPIEKYFYRWNMVNFSKSGPKPRILENPKCEVTIDELKEMYGNAPGEILYMGKFFYNQLKTENMYDVPILRSNECHSNIGVQPDPSVLISGKEFVEEYFQGTKYMAVHLRRGDFKEACQNYGDKDKCYLPIEEVVECLKSKLQTFNISDVYLATNANPEEIAYISKNVRPTGFREVRVVLLKIGQWEDKKWAIPLKHPNHLLREVFEVGLEKAICTLSSVFVGSWRSTFTGDIERLRYGFGTSDPRDSYICENTASSVEPLKNHHQKS